MSSIKQLIEDFGKLNEDFTFGVMMSNNLEIQRFGMKKLYDISKKSNISSKNKLDNLTKSIELKKSNNLVMFAKLNTIQINIIRVLIYIPKHMVHI